MKRKNNPTISIIVAIGNDWVVGINNKLPWDLPADMNHFRRLTMGKSIIMGQKTFESIGKPLPGRVNVVLTLDKNFKPKGCLVAHSIEEALERLKDQKEVMICGGVSVYKQFLPLADKIYLTKVEGDFKGDAFFPEIDQKKWQETEREECHPDGKNKYKCTFITLEKKAPEEVLVIPAKVIFEKENWQGFKKDNLDYYLNLIEKKSCFKLRDEVEKDPSWQQIIPYIIFNFKNKYFLYRYLEKASEKRLKNDYQLGVGGHINPVDLKGEKKIIETATIREWEEEIDYKGNLYEKKIVGILNDERRAVEKVHLGLVYLFRGDSPEISVREKEVLEGKLVELEDLGRYVKNSTSWAQIIYENLL